MLCYITEWMVSNILQPPYCLEELDINYTSQKRNIRSDMGQLLKVPSVRHLNCFFFDERRHLFFLSLMNGDIFFFLWWTQTSFFSLMNAGIFFLWTQTSGVSLHLGCLTIKWIHVHGARCTTSHRLLQRTQRDAQQFCIPQMWNEALCNRHQQKTD